MPKPTDPIALEFDHFGEKIADDPYPTYRYLRQNCPVGWSENYGGFWVLTRFDDINEALHKPDIFSSREAGIPPIPGKSGPLIPVEVDPPKHTAYRKVLDPFFGPKKIVQVMEPKARRLANELIDDMVQADGEVDFMTSFAVPYSTMLFCELVGWPETERPHLVEQADRILQLSTMLATDPEQYEKASIEIGLALAPFLYELLQQSLKSPEDDLVGLLTGAPGGERLLDDAEVLQILFTLIPAGLETVKSALGNTFSHLGTRDDLRDQIVADPTVIPTAVEEFLRFDSPVNTGRLVLQDTELNGQQIQAGEMVMLVTGSAGRDENVFANPDDIDLRRDPNRHLAFSAGRHRCVGAHLTRMELRVAFEEIHRRMPSYFIPEGASIKRHVGFTRGVDKLPFVTGQPALLSASR
jgi:cytochrome P450